MASKKTYCVVKRVIKTEDGKSTSELIEVENDLTKAACKKVVTKLSAEKTAYFEVLDSKQKTVYKLGLSGKNYEVKFKGIS